jgi:hypothetical protein
MDKVRFFTLTCEFSGPIQTKTEDGQQILVQTPDLLENG